FVFGTAFRPGCNVAPYRCRTTVQTCTDGIGSGDKTGSPKTSTALRYCRSMRALKNIFLPICFMVSALAAFADTPGQDMKTAGDAARTAVVKTGAATGKVTAKGAKATGRGIRWGAKKMALGTGAGMVKSGTALKSVGR